MVLSNMQKKYALIVAGGIGSRMNAHIPKQYLLMNGKPVVMHTLEQFARTKNTVELILVIHPQMQNFWQSLCQKYAFAIPHTVVHGGNTRFESVRNGINFIKKQHPNCKDTLIAIHDAARPLISPILIDYCFDSATAHPATVLAVPSINSIRIGQASENAAMDRNNIWQIQTPQTFHGELLAEAYDQEELASFTDDASVVEKMGNAIYLLEGDYRNIKITFPEDINIAQVYAASINF